jgi:ABC-type transport system substrate-binding protein
LFSRRVAGVLLLAFGVVSALALGACGGDEGAEPPIETAQSRALPPVPAGPPDRSLAIGLRRLPVGLDPLGDLDAWGLRIVEDLLFSGLVRRIGTGAPWVEYDLADRCERDSETATRRITCHIPRGRSFHDGTELEMEDVLYSLRFWLDPRRTALRAHHGLDALRSVEIVDGPVAVTGAKDPGRWIRLEFDRRDPLAMEKLAEIKVVPRKLHRGRDDRFAREPVGSGEWRFVSWGDDRLVVERVNQSEQDGEGVLHRLVFREFADGAQALTALRRGDLQILGELAPSYLPEELGKPGMAARFQGWMTTPPSYDLLLFNARGERGVAGNVRRALRAGVPRAAIARAHYGSPGWSTEAPVDRWAPVELDMDRLVDVGSEPLAEAGLVPWRDFAEDAEGAVDAAELFERLGWRMERGLRRRGDFSLRITLTWDGERGLATDLAQSVQAGWKQLGVSTPQAVASWGYLSGLMRKGEFEVALTHLSTHSQADLYPYFHSRGSQNLGGISDAALDEALVAFRNATTPQQRLEAQEQVAARLESLAALSVLRAPARVMLASRRVRGLVWTDDLPRLDELQLAPRGAAGVWERR